MGARVGRKVQRRGRNRPLASRSQEKRTGPLRAARKTPTTLRATACSGASTAINKKEEIFFLFLSYSSIAVFHFHSRPQSLWLSQSYTSTSASCFFLGVFNFFPLFLFSSVYSSRLRAHRPPPMPSFPCSLLYPPASRFPAMAENSVSA